MRSRSILIAALLASSLLQAQQTQQPAYKSDPKFQKIWEQAQQDARRTNTLAIALDEFRKANKIAGGQCVECIISVMKLQFKVGDYANAAATAVQLDSLVTAKPDKAYAESWHGTALFYAAGDKPKPAKLEDAHAAFAAAISNGSREPVTFFYDGRTLALLHRDEEARADFQHYLDIAPANDRGRSRVAHFLADPDLARQKMAPPFTVVTDAGRTFNLDDMNGKVVLIDFWATWCGPCNEELPNVKKIAADFANDPFELISVSWDSNESAWRQFIAKNGMTWNQYRDADHKLSDAFAINAIPHYFTIDSDGVLRAEVLGSGNDVEGRLKKLVAKAREAAAASAAKAPSQPANLGN